MAYHIPELKVTLLREPSPVSFIFDNPDKIWEVWESVKLSSWFDPEKECLVVVSLDKRNKVKGFFLVSLGTLDQTFAYPRDIFRPVIADASAAFVLIHNHPSGCPEPSLADIEVTRRIREAGNLMQIPLIDHVIVGEGKYYSFKEAGMV